MSHFFVEVKASAGKNGKSKLLGLHESTSFQKPDPAYGGDAVLAVNELEYNLLRASRGNIKALKDAIKVLDADFEGEPS